MHYLRNINPLFSLTLLVFALSCTEGMDGEATAPDSALAACECSDVAALAVSYDNADTGLTGETVQAAVTEVALRDVADRVFVMDAESAAPLASGTAGASAQCGGSEGTTMALGGGCDIDNSNATLVTAELRDSSFFCEWNKPAGQAATGVARVSCMSLTE